MNNTDSWWSEFSMSKKTILFLGTSLIGALYIQEAAEYLGFNAVFLLHIEDYSGDSKRAIQKSEHYEANVNSLADVVRAIHENNLMQEYNVIGITSFLDETFQIVVEVAKQFGIVGPDPILAALTDKSAVYQMIPEFSSPSLIFTLSDMSQKNIEQFFNQHKNINEFMLKPSVSSGAVGISILNKKTDFEEIKQLIHSAEIEGISKQHWIIQPRIFGRLHSLEGYVRNGQIFFLGFSRRVRKNLTEIVTEFPVDNELPLPIQQQCHNAVQALVERSCYMNGYFHCEFIINVEKNAAYFIDGNMGRAAGGPTVQQIASIYGKKPIDIFTHIIDLGLFQGKNSSNFCYGKRDEKRMLSIRYCLADPAIVIGVTLPSEMTSFHIQVAGDNKKVPGVGTSDSAWVGFIAGYKEQVLAEIQKIVIETDKGLVRPFYTLEE